MVEPAQKHGQVSAVIVQPMFFPWRGQFDLQSRADIVIILDTVQWVKRHWYNRNLIHGAGGKQWMTVPVSVNKHHELAIADVRIDDEDRSWQRKILNALRHAYSKTPYFDLYFPEVERLISLPWTRIASLAEASLRFGFKALNRPVTMVRASELAIDTEVPIDRLIALCRASGANHYISGPAAKSYIGDSMAFVDADIELEWMEYDYPPYPQVNPFHDQELSILDLLFNTGTEAERYIWQEPES